VRVAEGPRGDGDLADAGGGPGDEPASGASVVLNRDHLTIDCPL
jgi:hypothetical protein